MGSQNRCRPVAESGAPVSVDPTRVCELLFSWPDLVVLEVTVIEVGGLRVRIETSLPRPVCSGCGGVVHVKDRNEFDTMLAHATQVADPFPVHKLANTLLDECRRRVQNETF